ncbi:Hpt domain-containing protein [Aliishimia ponticola]|uniref:Hpt domain-containing protein n=1 Tax=Aliishimia ponticola TaxID=2499833 RepID=UPI0026A89CDA
MSALIDWNKVHELREDIGREDFSEVVDLFLEEVELTIAALGNADRSMEHDLHFLKGSASNLGFVAFADLCRQGETAASQGNAGKVNVPEIVGIYRDSKDAFLTDFDLKLAG